MALGVSNRTPVNEGTSNVVRYYEACGTFCTLTRSPNRPSSVLNQMFSRMILHLCGCWGWGCSPSTHRDVLCMKAFDFVTFPADLGAWKFYQAYRNNRNILPSFDLPSFTGSRSISVHVGEVEASFQTGRSQ